MRRLEGKRSGICTVAWAPDGRTLCAGTRDGSVALWDLTAGAERRVLTFDTRLEHYDFEIALAPDGRTLAAGGQYLPLAFRDLDTGEPLALVHLEPTTGAFSLAFSPDGRSFAAVPMRGADGQHDLRRWDLATRNELAPPLMAHGCTIASLAFAPDSQRLAAYVFDRTMRVFDLAAGREAACWRAPSEVTGLAWLPDGGTLVVTHSRSVVLWDTTRGRATAKLKGHTRRINDVAVAPDGRTLCTASDDGSVRRWSAADGACLATFDLKMGRARALAFSPDGQTLAAAGDDGALALWNPSTETAS